MSPLFLIVTGLVQPTPLRTTLVKADQIILPWSGSHLLLVLLFCVLSVAISLNLEVIRPGLGTRAHPCTVVFSVLVLAASLSFYLRMLLGAWTCLPLSCIWPIFHARVVLNPRDWPLLLSLFHYSYPFLLWRRCIPMYITSDCTRGNEWGKLIPVLLPSLSIVCRLFNPPLWTKLLGLQSGKFFSPHLLHFLPFQVGIQ